MTPRFVVESARLTARRHTGRRHPASIARHRRKEADRPEHKGDRPEKHGDRRKGGRRKGRKR